MNCWMNKGYRIEFQEEAPKTMYESITLEQMVNHYGEGNYRWLWTGVKTKRVIPSNTEQPVSEDADAGCGVMDQLDIEAEQAHDTGPCVSTSAAGDQPLFDCPEPLCSCTHYHHSIFPRFQFSID